jgi:hypothetical protein
LLALHCTPKYITIILLARHCTPSRISITSS